MGRRRFPVNRQDRFKTDSANGIAEATAAGIGISALLDAIAESYVARGRLIGTMMRYVLPEVGIFVVRPQGCVSRNVRVLIDSLLEAFG